MGEGQLIEKIRSVYNTDFETVYGGNFVYKN
ncbi:Uncharacterised protein [Candidatus Bartonella washoeensis]|nr:Uncharacterised protein [Bartonella washoeensis]